QQARERLQPEEDEREARPDPRERPRDQRVPRPYAGVDADVARDAVEHLQREVQPDEREDRALAERSHRSPSCHPDRPARGWAESWADSRADARAPSRAYAVRSAPR